MTWRLSLALFWEGLKVVQCGSILKASADVVGNDINWCRLHLRSLLFCLTVSMAYTLLKRFRVALCHGDGTEKTAPGHSTREKRQECALRVLCPQTSLSWMQE